MLQLHTNEDELDAVKNTPHLSYGAGDAALASASEVYLSSPALFLSTHIKDEYNSLFNTGKDLSKDQIPDYLQNKFPNGGNEDSVAFADKIYKRHKENEQALQNIKNNYSTKGAAIGASFVAGVLDPIGIVAGGVVGKVLTEAETVYNLTSMMGRAGIGNALTKGVGVSAASGAAFMTPSALSSYEFRKNVGDDPRPMEILTDIGSGALLGGTIHAGINAFKYFKPFSYDTVSSISNLANKTVQKGKKFSADMLIRAGIRKSVEEAEAAGVYSDIEASTDNLESKINKAKSAFSEIKTDEQSFYKDLKEAVDVTKNISETRTEQENAILDSFNSIPQFSELLDAVNTHVNERTVEQSKIINDFIKNEDFETQAIQKNIDDIDKKISKIELSKDENMIEEKNKLIEQRKSIEQIKETKKSYRKITTEQRKALINLLDAEKIKAHNDLMIRARDEVEPISYQDIKAESDKINSIENSPDLYPRESDAGLTDYNDSSRVANEKQEQPIDQNSKYEMAEEILNKQIMDESLPPEMVDYLSESVESENAADEEAVNSIDEAIDNTCNCITGK